MKINRLLFNTRIDLKKLYIPKVIVGILLGLCYAVLIYLLLYLFLDFYRIVSSYFHLPSILNEKDRFYYKLFFAVIGFVIGNSIAVSFILSSSKQTLQGNNLKRRQVINDHAFLNSSFVYWFSKVGFTVTFAVLLGVEFSFFIELKTPMLLLFIVLYLESWKTLGVLIKRQKLKYQLIHFSVLLIFSLLLTQLDVINHDKIDKNILRYKPLINLPESNYNNMSYHNRFLNVYLSEKNENKLLFGYYSNDLDKSYLDFMDFRLKNRESTQKFVSIRVSADRNTPMRVIKRIQEQVWKSGVKFIAYATSDKDINSYRTSKSALNVKIEDGRYYEYNRQPFPLEDIYKETEYKHILDTVFVDIGRKNMKSIFKDNINSHTIFLYNLNQNTKYQDYLNTLSTHMFYVDSLRNTKIKVNLLHDENFRIKNRKEYFENQQCLKDEYSLKVIEKY